MKPRGTSSTRLAVCAGALSHSMTLAFLLASAAPAVATTEYTLPTLFDVVGVASNDVLNIRAAPTARSAIIGELSADEVGVEVVGLDASGKWARVNADGQGGWVALRFLSYRIDVWEPGTLPPGITCIGTEPFWSLSLRGRALMFSSPEQDETAIPVRQVFDTGVFRDPRRSVVAGTGSEQITASIVPMACSDGMSDRAYGLDITLLRADRGRTEMLTGCCSIAPR